MNNMATQMELFEPVKKGLKDGSLVTTASPSDQLLIDFNAVAADYNESRDITGTKRAITGQEMMSIFDALVGDKMQLSPVKMQEGGLLDEGGTKDPVSGNDVPPGSMQEEVRDDIPAQLSEGEFVFPADVVRFIGLEKLMKIRQRAKAGLKMMEEMGQMGNSEEAIIPDDLPFSIDDLDMEDDGLEMNQGGLVNMSNGGMIGPLTTGLPATVSNALGSQVGQVGSFNPPQIPGSMGMNPLGTAPAPMQAASSLSLPPPTSGVDPNLGGTKFTGTAIQPITVPFQEAKGPGVINVEEKNVVYVNEAGQERTFIVRADGTIIDPATGLEVNPEALGFKVKTDATKTQTTTGTGVKTAQVSEGQDDNQQDDGTGGGAAVAWGGTTKGAEKGLKVGSTKVGIGYTKIDPATGKPLTGLSGIPNIFDFGKVIGGNIKGELPAGYGAVMILDNVITDLSNKDFNIAKKNGFMGNNADVSLDVARTNVAAANIMQSRYGLTNRDRPMTIDAIAKEAARSDKGIAELAKDYGFDVDDVKDNPFSSIFGKNYNDAVAKAVEAANTNRVGLRPDGKGTFDKGAVPFTADDIKAGHAARTAIEAQNQATIAAAQAKNEADRDEGGGVGPGGPGDTGPGGTGQDVGVDETGSTGFGTGTDCLTEDMKVKLNGVIDFVTNIKVGDTIDNYRVKEVLHKHMRNGYYAINNELKISNDHPVLANGTWTRPEDLSVGDSINGIPVVSLEYVEQLTPTVSIVIDGESFDVHTENNIYIVHGRYREVRQEAA